MYGDSRARACSATVSYQKGIGLAIMFSQNQTDIIVTGVDVFPGKSYRAELWTSNGAHGVLTARAFQSNSVAFEAIDENTIRALVESKQFAIEGLGPFDLNGSRNAMASAWQCFKALNGL